MKHEQTKRRIDGSDIIDTMYRSVVISGDSKTLSLTRWLDDWGFVQIDLIEKGDNSITVKISKVEVKKE